MLNKEFFLKVLLEFNLIKYNFLVIDIVLF